MYVNFPVAYRWGDVPDDGIGGPAVDDAGTIYIVRDEFSEDDWPDGDCPYGESIENVLVNKTTLAEIVTEYLDGWKELDGYTGNMHVASSDALASALRAAADMLDAGKRQPKINTTPGGQDNETN